MIDTIEKNKLLKNIMKTDFILTELNLYLNTHPKDKKALSMHAQARETRKTLVMKYQEMFGPLSANSSGNEEMWEWIKGPWPWEN